MSKVTYTKRTVESYHIVPDQADQWRCCWAIVNVDSATGTLTANTDCGDYSYRWGYNEHEDFKHLLMRIDDSYLLNKISDRSEFDAKETIKKIKKTILQWRHCGDLEKDDAREMWDKICEADDECYQGNEFEGFVYREMGEDYYDLIEKDYPTGAKTFVEVVFKCLKGILRQEAGHDQP